MRARCAVVAIGVKSATAPAVTSCEGDGEAQASEHEDSEQMCGILGVGVVWDCVSAGHLRPNWLAPTWDLGSPVLVSGDTKVVSTASWLPPHIGSPLAMTSMRRSTTLDRFWMLRSA